MLGVHWAARWLECRLPVLQQVIGGEALAAHAYRTWRFENLTREVMDALNVWARFVFEPLLEDRRQTLDELTGDIHGRATAEVIASFDPAALAHRQADLLARHGLALPP